MAHKVLNYQSVLDITIQQTGSLEGLFDVLRTNPQLKLNELPEVGSEYFITSSPVDEDVANSLSGEGRKLATLDSFLIESQQRVMQFRQQLVVGDLDGLDGQMWRATVFGPGSDTDGLIGNWALTSVKAVTDSGFGFGPSVEVRCYSTVLPLAPNLIAVSADVEIPGPNGVYEWPDTDPIYTNVPDPFDVYWFLRLNAHGDSEDLWLEFTIERQDG